MSASDSFPVPDNYPALIARSAEAFGDAQAILDCGAGSAFGADSANDPNRVWSFNRLAADTDRCAAALVASGLEPGDRVGIWAPNTAEWLIAAMGVLAAGGVIVPVNTRFKGREAAYVLGKSKAKLLFTVVGFLGYDYLSDLRQAAHQAAENQAVEGGGEALPDLQEIILLTGSEPLSGDTDTAPVVSFDSFMARVRAMPVAGSNYVKGSDLGATPGPGETTLSAYAEVDARRSQLTSESLGLIMFTSGTTGMPKGVLIQQGRILRGFSHYARELAMRQGDRMLVINPFFHAFGFCGAMTPCFIKGATVLPHPVFEPGEVLQRLEAERITILPGPPAIFQALLNHSDFEKYDLSSLRAAVTGAATVPVETVVEMRERMGFQVVMTAYGMTETHGLATLTLENDPPELVASTSGKALPGIELRIVDDDGNDLPPDVAGELLIRGYCVTEGYLDDPEQTAATIDADGWLHTGDVCVMNEDGYIDITDRKKDMYINGGFNVYPAEVERVMMEHPAIGQVAVIGVPDERLGEAGAAFVVPAPTADSAPGSLVIETGSPLAHDSLREWCRERMANYKVPSHFWLVPELPLNPSNKVLKTELRLDAQERLGN